MQEHEKLNYINNKIGFDIQMVESGYNIEYDEETKRFVKHYESDGSRILADVREIIFTPQFIELLDDFMDRKTRGRSSNGSYFIKLMDNLKDPVEFIYNLIK